LCQKAPGCRWVGAGRNQGKEVLKKSGAAGGKAKIVRAKRPWNRLEAQKTTKAVYRNKGKASQNPGKNALNKGTKRRGRGV